MSNTKKTGGFSVGITSIAVIFTVLCLTIFAVLSISTASEEKELAVKYADSVSAYWAADGRCVDTVNGLRALWKSGAGEAELIAAAESSGAEAVADSGTVYISFSEDINSVRAIAVSLEIGDDFAITAWQEIYTGEWEADPSLDVWQGGDW